MKKLISIMLSAVILMLSVFCVSASADSYTSEKILSDFSNTKTICLDLADENFANEYIEISDVQVKGKFIEGEGGKLDDLKILVSAKLGFLKVEIRFIDGQVFAYIPLFRAKINITSLLGESFDIESLIGSLDGITHYLENGLLNCFKVTSSVEKDVDGYGKVVVENLTIKPAEVVKFAVKEGKMTLPEGVDANTLTDEQAIEYIMVQDNSTREEVDNWLKSNIEVYLKGEKIVAMKINIYDENGNVQTTDLEDELSFKIDSISTNVSDKEFEDPFLYFDITGLFSWIIPMLIGEAL